MMHPPQRVVRLPRDRASGIAYGLPVWSFGTMQSSDGKAVTGLNFRFDAVLRDCRPQIRDWHAGGPCMCTMPAIMHTCRLWNL